MTTPYAPVKFKDMIILFGQDIFVQLCAHVENDQGEHAAILADGFIGDFDFSNADSEIDTFYVEAVELAVMYGHVGLRIWVTTSVNYVEFKFPDIKRRHEEDE